MQYQLAFAYFVGRKPNGWTNLLLVTVCTFIPILGPIVLLGYRAEVSEKLLRDPDLRRYPDFDFDRFTTYLERGIWPFLVSLVASLAGLPLIAAAWGAIIAGVAAGGAAVIAGVVAAFLLVVVGSVAVAAVTVPLTFHAEIANRFDLGGGFRFAVDFLKRVGGLAVLTYILFVPLAMAAVFVGLLACFIGVYPVAALVQMAGQHLMTQLYREYLDRGGEEIVKTEKRRRRRYDDEDDGPEEYDIDDDRGRRS